jgi:hypothetical protein
MRRAYHRIAILLAAALAAGCAEPGASPVAPEPGGRADGLLGTVSATIDLTGVLSSTSLTSLLSPRHAEKVIRAGEGGFVELNGFRVDIPAGALPADTRVTIDLPSDGLLSRHLIAEFGPHGIQFNQPVTLSFPLNGVSLSGGPIEVARWEGDQWRSLGGSISADGTRLQGRTPHFSTYGGKYVLAGG